MGYNVPSYDTSRFSFGQGILYMGAPGTTPLVDVGAVRGDAEFSVERTLLEMKQGSPQTRAKAYVIEEKVTLKVTGVEWDLDNLSYALGAGVTSVSGTVNEILEFGGDMSINNRALRYLHIAPDGSTIDLHIFKAEGNGKLAISMKETDFHEFPFEFQAVIGSTDFTGAAISASNKKLFKIIRTRV